MDPDPVLPFTMTPTAATLSGAYTAAHQFLPLQRKKQPTDLDRAVESSRWLDAEEPYSARVTVHLMEALEASGD